MKIFTLSFFFLIALLTIPCTASGIPATIHSEWGVPLPESGNPANELPRVMAAGNPVLITVNYQYQPNLFVFDGNGTLLWNTTLAAEKTPWLSSASLFPDGSGLVVTQLEPGCCHGSVTNTSQNKVLSFDRTGKTSWEYITWSPPLSSSVLRTTRDILIGTGDGQIFCLNENGSVRWKTAVEAPVTALTTSDDGNTIIATGESNYDSSIRYGESLHPFDLFILDCDGVVLGKYQMRGVNIAKSNNNGSVIAVSGGPFGNLMVFNRSGTRLYERSFPAIPRAIAMTGNGSRIIIETAGGGIYCLDTGGREVWKKIIEPGSQGLAISGSRQSVALGNGTIIEVYDITGELLGAYPAGSKVRSVAMVPGSDSFLVGSDGELFFISVAGANSEREQSLFSGSQILPTSVPVAPVAPTTQHSSLPYIFPLAALCIAGVLAILSRLSGQ
jgi:hypothetical protein